jgi:hypothetical protein
MRQAAGWRPEFETLLLSDLKTVGRGLASAAIRDDLVGDLLALIEAAQAGALNGADVNENVRSTSVRLDETKALLAVEPLDGACIHECRLSDSVN